ncbi:MAG: toxin [Balneolaceae bacterium]|nr:MAG: toxin [Balneolaceae bacterium]
MKYFKWDEDKNRLLKQKRNISFEDIVLSVSSGGLLDVLNHPNPEKYPKQMLIIVEVKNYAFVVPFIENDNHYFLKTIYPSRKATKIYIDHE